VVLCISRVGAVDAVGVVGVKCAPSRDVNRYHQACSLTQDSVSPGNFVHYVEEEERWTRHIHVRMCRSRLGVPDEGWETKTIEECSEDSAP
jgi:hypothetical protein